MAVLKGGKNSTILPLVLMALQAVYNTVSAQSRRHVSLDLPTVPRWSAPVPNHTKPLGGYSLIRDAIHTEIYHGDIPHGTYNHAAMIGLFNNTLMVAWKNGPYIEDKNGQRILFALSTDGLTWSKTDGTVSYTVFVPSFTDYVE